MSIISQAQRLLLPLKLPSLGLTQKRFNTRQAIHRYVEPNKFKKHMLAACEPYFRPEYNLPEDTCKGTKQTEIDLIPLERILVNELIEDINKSNFILFMQYNFAPFQSERVYKNTITKSGGKIHALNNRVFKEAFRILELKEVSQLFITRNAVITGRTDDLPKCVKVMKKMPQFILLGGYIDRHLYNVDRLQAISATTNIDQCRANLVSILETPGISLASNLEQYAETIKPNESEAPTK